MCQSYEIIDSQRVGDTEVVLGYSPTEVSPYVTWKCYAYDNFQGYNYGRYFGDEESARRNSSHEVRRLSRSYSLEACALSEKVGKNDSVNAFL